MKYLAIIPARYASTRFPGKPLASLANKFIVQHVYERVSSVIEHTFIATDDQRIYEAAQSFQANVVMTSAHHKSGTDRCFEALTKIEEKCNTKFDVVINVQGDEPFIAQEQILSVQSCFEDVDTDIATLIKPYAATDTIEALENPNSPKVVIDDKGFALYFSRSVIPYLRDVDKKDWLSAHTYYKHLGLYAYKAEVLRAITQLPQGMLEKCESLEQLRWLQAGYKIKTKSSTIETIGIDTPENLIEAENFLKTSK